MRCFARNLGRRALVLGFSALVLAATARAGEPAYERVAGSAANGKVYDARITGREILTPAPPAAPRINTPEVYGCRPGRPLIYRIPATGQRPIQFAAQGLPEGVKLDAATGILTGTTPARKGEYRIELKAANRHGEDSAAWTLVVGDTLALTPPMGWNHWYTHYHHVTDKTIRQAADTMVSSGMADVGYSFVSIDDCWMRISREYVRESTDPARRTASRGLNIEMKVGPTRDAEGRYLPARDFPDMKALTDYIHHYGLKAGIYTSPGPRTCQRFEGSHGHEALDARTFAEWGFDLLKYDWCSYGQVVGRRPTLEDMQKPYRQMGRLLAEQQRDIVLNLCQYGMGEVWKWGKEVGGHSWRIGGDLGHTLTKGGLYPIARKTIALRAYNGPGSWNDPDYVILGNWRSPFVKTGPLVAIQLSPNEQYTYMSLWCLMACPLFFSGDMGTLDHFTRNILCNPELIAVNQDRLGKCCEGVEMGEQQWIVAKPLADGSLAVGLFNLDAQADRRISVDWSQLGLDRPRRARDLWRHKDLGMIDSRLSVLVGAHGCAVIRLSAP